MKKLSFIICLLSFICSCSNQKLAAKKLRAVGYNKIVLCPYNNCVCSNGDIYYTGFVATKNNTINSGYVYKTGKNKFKIVVDR